MLLGTALEATVFICEVPTGIVADAYSRRLSIILGNFIIGGAWLLMGFTTGFWPILLSQVLWGLGYTFTSGATQAWISDEVGEEQAAGIFVASSTYATQLSGSAGKSTGHTPYENASACRTFGSGHKAAIQTDTKPDCVIRSRSL